MTKTRLETHDKYNPSNYFINKKKLQFLKISIDLKQQKMKKKSPFFLELYYY